MEDKRFSAYKYIFNKKNGYKKDAIENIGEELFDEFCTVGYIHNGMDGAWVERWEITDFGKTQLLAYLKFIEETNNLQNIITKINDEN